MSYRIRDFRDRDAEPLAALALRAIVVIGPRAYSPAQVAAWAARHGEHACYRDRHHAGDSIFVAVDASDRPCAYAILERDGHLDHLYCDPDHTRRGLAEDLLVQAEERAVAWGAARLFTEASELARTVFERSGYRVTHRRDFEIEGTPIHNYAMEKALDAQDETRRKLESPAD